MKNTKKMTSKNLEKMRRQEAKRKAIAKEKRKIVIRDMLFSFVVSLLGLAIFAVYIFNNYHYYKDSDLQFDGGKCISAEQANRAATRAYNYVITLDNGNSYYIAGPRLSNRFSFFDRLTDAKNSGKTFYVRYSDSYSKKLQAYEIAELIAEDETFLSLQRTNTYNVFSICMLFLLYLGISSGVLYLIYLKKFHDLPPHDI